MEKCLFCQSMGPFNTIEHIIPESLGNDDLLLRGQVCDSCQAYFGKEVEQFVLNKTPIAFWRTFLGIKTKKGKNPSVNLNQPKIQKGVFPTTHPKHDNVGYTYHEDGSVSIDIDDLKIVNDIKFGAKSKFSFGMTPKVLHMLGRFLCKVGLELLCLNDSNQAKSDEFQASRQYARFGEFKGLWPIFHFTNGSLRELRRINTDEEGLLEEVDCYSYSLLFLKQDYVLFLFTMGTDNWVISLNDPYPKPAIRDVFPNNQLNLIWYSNEEWKNAS
ncbi:MAG: hypothetical protein JEZ00_11945 [Anaerolineaceae bacterium]|nr:hypothetical protein [Anaerolineaceae bacterium]